VERVNGNDGREAIMEKRGNETKIRKGIKEKKKRFVSPSSLMAHALLAI
jgi:hypothetical protein